MFDQRHQQAVAVAAPRLEGSTLDEQNSRSDSAVLLCRYVDLVAVADSSTMRAALCFDFTILFLELGNSIGYKLPNLPGSHSKQRRKRVVERVGNSTHLRGRFVGLL